MCERYGNSNYLDFIIIILFVSILETDSSDESGTFLPLGIDTDNIHGNVYVCDYRNSCVIKFDDKLEFITQWRIYNHSDQYDEGRIWRKKSISFSKSIIV